MSAVELPVVDSVVSEVVVVEVESAVPLERLDVVEVVSWLDKDVVVLEVVDVVGVVRSSKFSESEVSTSTVPVASLESVGSRSAGGTATSGDASGSDGSSSSSSSCASSSSGTRIVDVPRSSAHAAGIRLPGVPVRKKRLLRKSRGRSAVTKPAEEMPPRRTNRSLSLYPGRKILERPPRRMAQ
ncbi:MAG: hypothetical protein HYZ89_05025 [Candidatus Omnitrophica bacterium]|nr:hypothetical protein [Candidatus Omnitrophota bacterium]